MPDLVNRIIAFEDGELEFSDTIKLFADLVKTGTINSLQGSYQRAARQFILDGFITPAGDVVTY